MTLNPQIERQERLRTMFAESFQRDPSTEEMQMLALSLQCEPIHEGEGLAQTGEAPLPGGTVPEKAA